MWATIYKISVGVSLCVLLLFYIAKYSNVETVNTLVIPEYSDNRHSNQPRTMQPWVYQYGLSSLFTLVTHTNNISVPESNDGSSLTFEPRDLKILTDISHLHERSSVQVIENTVDTFDKYRYPKPVVPENFCKRVHKSVDQTGQNKANFDDACGVSRKEILSTPVLLIHGGYVESRPLINEDVPGFVFNHEYVVHIARWINGNDWKSVPLVPRVQPGRVIRKFDELIAITGTSYPLANGHLPTQSLPRLLRALAVASKSAKVMLCGNNGFIRKLIQPLVDSDILAEDRIVVYDRDVLAYASKLFFVDGATHTGSNMLLVDRVYKGIFGYHEPEYFVLIHRSENGGRWLQNENEVIKYIESRGERIVVFNPNPTLAKDIAIFQHARGVLSPHGAGLFNVLFTPPNAAVLEFGYSEGYSWPDEYFYVTVASNRKYFCSITEGGYSTPLLVNMNEFDKVFTEMLHFIDQS